MQNYTNSENSRGDRAGHKAVVLMTQQDHLRIASKEGLANPHGEISNSDNDEFRFGRSPHDRSKITEAPLTAMTM